MQCHTLPLGGMAGPGQHRAGAEVPSECGVGRGKVSKPEEELETTPGSQRKEAMHLDSGFQAREVFLDVSRSTGHQKMEACDGASSLGLPSLQPRPAGPNLCRERPPVGTKRLCGLPFGGFVTQVVLGEEVCF